MIAAANADGTIDTEERGRILKKLETLELSEEEHRFILRELLSPARLEEIAAEVATPQLARQVWAVSLMAITVDTEAEKVYLDALARRLGIDAQTRAAICAKIGVPCP